ncbi:putative lipid II flippase FtsW [Sporanaerobacter sp. PP17-6a]|jgi:cell division protein FtsW|uniref:putative lipid II flippase FtsW n=1 Tax=Sporanaerobacter sp. PP17-6a TaxID=1891289 RepID=UPI0008A05882|nr:putative lipid II flippase FtsW [Sporanaerobacter sp. PP17-6a]MBE6081907.1 putative lipid II flippase FtsW [Tissierellaceae bacterium]SCL84803.1 Cell division protein FtsW [Sporanaerobacter sp. PP17-6a]
MAKKKSVDFTLLLATMLLVFIGIIMVFSSSWPDAIYKMKDGYFYLKKQLMAGLIGLAGMFFFMNFDYKRLDKMSKLIFLITIISGLLIFSPLGVEYNGARRWINLGFTTFMPSDLIKFGSIIFFASFLSKRKEDIKSIKKGLIPSLVVIGISCGLIYIQKALSTTVTLALTLVAMLFISGMRISHMIVLGIGGTAALYFSIVSHSYRVARYLSFKDPFAYKSEGGYQVVQSLYALGSGGLFGLGLGKSRQKFFYIPEPYNDFIFSIIGEELGFLGCITIILLFVLVIWRGIKIALNVEDLFGCLLSSGIVALITIQTLIHIAVVTSSIPPTGIPLPFISYGGTSLAIYMSAIGILLNISRNTNLSGGEKR